MNKCEKCGGPLSSNGYCHSCSFTSDVDFKQICNICNQYFTHFDEYSEHAKSHPKCKYCEDRFDSEIELQKHIKVHECPICHLYFHSITKHKKQQHFQCDLCEKWFLDKKALNEHLAKHPLYCDLCKKWLLDTEHTQHLSEHPQCKYCKNRFNTQEILTSHIEYYHKCNICYGYFSDVRSHIKNEHIYCRTCRKYFINSDQYNRKHPNCQYCNERFENKVLLENHILHYHYCNFCKNYFSSSKGLDIHMREMHPEWVKLRDAIESHFNSMYGFGGPKNKFNK